jgi:lipoate-protein ligase B
MYLNIRIDLSAVDKINCCGRHGLRTNKFIKNKLRPMPKALLPFA